MMRAFCTIIAFCLLLCSCSGGSGIEVGTDAAADQPVGCQKISADVAKQMMDDAQNYILIDVRTKDEYEEAHIEGAVLIPVDEIEDRAGELLPDKDAMIFLYCRSGNRSARAGGALAGLGYTQVFDFGGIGDWPYGTVSGQ